MTLFEVMIAIAIIGLMMIVGYMGVRDVRQSDLREDAMKVAATLRGAYTRATRTGRHHRVVFDLERQRFHVESCEGDVKLRKVDPEEEPEQTREELLERLENQTPTSDQIPELLEATSPEKATEVSAALAGVRLGGVRCKPLEEGAAGFGGGVHELRTDLGIEIDRVFAQHLRDPAKKGRATVNFFPLGYAEKAIVEVASEEAAFSLLIYRLTGRVEFKTGRLEDPDDFMRRNAMGDEEEQR